MKLMFQSALYFSLIRSRHNQFPRIAATQTAVYFNHRLGAAHLKSWAKYAFSMFLVVKMLKNNISTSVWSAQHPNTGQNLQHLQTVDIFFQNEMAYFVLTPLPSSVNIYVTEV